MAALARCSRSPTRVDWCSAVKVFLTLSSRVVGRLPVTNSVPATMATPAAAMSPGPGGGPAVRPERQATNTISAARVPRALLREADAAIAQTVR